MISFGFRISILLIFASKKAKKKIFGSGNCLRRRQKCYRNPFFGCFEPPKGYERHPHRFLGKVKFFQLSFIGFRGHNWVKRPPPTADRVKCSVEQLYNLYKFCDFSVVVAQQIQMFIHILSLEIK